MEPQKLPHYILASTMFAVLLSCELWDGAPCNDDSNCWSSRFPVCRNNRCDVPLVGGDEGTDDDDGIGDGDGDELTSGGDDWDGGDGGPADGGDDEGESGGGVDLPPMSSECADAQQNENTQWIYDVSLGPNFTCAIEGHDRLVCWGDNYHYQLGPHQVEAVGIEPNDKEVGANAHSMAAVSPIVVNAGGGLDHTSEFRAAAAGFAHVCAIKKTADNSGVVCWGSNSSGALGRDTQQAFYGGTSQSMKALAEIDLGSGQVATQIALGENFGCAVVDADGGEEVKCWGHNDDGQLGQGHSHAVGDGGFDGDGDDESDMGDLLAPVGLVSAGLIDQLVVGRAHACVLVEGDVYCWGDNAYGQLGIGSVEDLGDDESEIDEPVQFGADDLIWALAAGDDHTCAIVSDVDSPDSYEVKCWGRNSFDQLGIESTNDALVPVGRADLGASLAGPHAHNLSAGNGHTCVILDDESVMCWGKNNHGQLGVDPDFWPNPVGVLDSSRVDIGEGWEVKQIEAGGDHTCVMLREVTADKSEKKVLKCWGANTSGQLGLDDTDDRGDHACEMGNALPLVKLKGTPQNERSARIPNGPIPGPKP